MPPENLKELLENTVNEFGHSEALLFSNKKISYRKLQEHSNRFANSLAGLGIQEQRVAIFLLNSPEFIISYFGIIKSGSTAVPINNMFKEEEAEFILNDSGAAAIITSAHFLPIIEAARQNSPSLKKIILIDIKKDGLLNFYEMIKASSGENTDIEISEDDIASILYTSGTTGHPKGAMLTHKNFISNALACVKASKLTHKDNVICFLPMFHSFAWTVCVVMPLCVGAKITIIDTLKPFRKLVRNVVKKKVTVFPGIPSLFHIFSDFHIPKELEVRILKMIEHLRLCISGAAALPREVLIKFQEKFKTPLLEGYGLTETSPVVSLNPICGEQKPGSVGLPIEGVEVRVVDEKGIDCQIDEPGELLVKGPNVMKGYLNNPHATAETIKDGWLYTGDIAKIDSLGYIYIVDRKKDMVNVRGLNVYPKEVENVLVMHPAIREAAVVRSFDKNKGEVPKAFIVLKNSEQQLKAHEIIHFCKDHLADFKIPKNVEFIEALPKNTLGKVLKMHLETCPVGAHENKNYL